MGLSAVLFDMDGLLVNTEPMWLIAETDLVAELGGSWTLADNLAVLGSALPNVVAYIRDLTGTELPAERVAEMMTERMLDLLATAEIDIQPGAIDLIRAVAEENLPYGLVSASERSMIDLVMVALARAGAPNFPISVAGDEVARSKPDPMPYLHAAELLGVDIRRTVILEDSANGVAAGWASGATVIAVPDAVPIEARERVVIRPSLVGLGVADLRDVLAG